MKEAGVDHGGLRRVGLAMIASSLFDPEAGYVLCCLGSNGEDNGMVQLNPDKALADKAVAGYQNKGAMTW